MPHPLRDDQPPGPPEAPRPEEAAPNPEPAVVPPPASRAQADWRSGTATQPGGLPPLAAGGDVTAGELSEIDADEADHPV